MPRSRPDAALLAESLRGESDDPALAAPAEDALAALEAISEGAPPRAEPEPMQVALAAPQPEPAPIADADRAILAGFAAIDDLRGTTPSDALTQAAAIARGDATPLPRPRPLTLAFAGTGLQPASRAIEPPPEPAPIAAPAATPASAPAAPLAREDARDSDPVRQLITASSERDFAGFAMPEPATAPALFRAPDFGCIGHGRREFRAADRPLQRPAAEEPAAEESFFTRLFASLAQ